MYALIMPGILFFVRQFSFQTALLLLLLIGIYGFGTTAVKRLGFRNLSSPEPYVYSFALGMGIFAHLIFGLGSLGLLYREAVIALVAVGLLISLVEFYRNRLIYLQKISQLGLPKKIHWFTVLMVVLLVSNWIYPLFANAFVPPLSWDEVAYHFAIPKIFIRNHAITYIPFIPYSNWPLETEQLFAAGLLFSSETLAHLITWVDFVLVCAGLYFFGRRYFTREVGVLAAVIFAWTPMVTTLAGTGLIELPLTLYTLLATLTLIEWMQSGERPYWILSALFGGLAASTKLNAAVVPLILGILLAVVIIIRQRDQLPIAVKHFVLYGLIAFAVVAPWYVKTWVQTGSPFWPFLFPILGGKNWDALGSEYLFDFIRSPNMALTPLNWLRGLWEMSAHPVKFGAYRYTLGWFYLPLIPFFIPVLILARPCHRQVARWLGVLALIYYTSWFFQTHQTRFFMPAASVLSLVAAIGAWWLWSFGRGRWTFFIQLSLVVFIMGFHWLANPADRALLKSHWPLLSGQVTRKQFLQSKIPGYEVFAYANKNLTPDSYIWLALYESRGYYLDHDYMWANPISQRTLRLESFENADQLAGELKARGFTHILFLSQYVDEYSTIPYGRKITDLTRALLANHARLIYRTEPLELYELLP